VEEHEGGDREQRHGRHGLAGAELDAKILAEDGDGGADHGGARPGRAF